MSTYLYTYASSSSREMLAKYDSGYIYDCRKSRYESSAPIIAKDQNGYLCKSARASYEYTDIYVSRNVLYRKGTGHSDTLLIAKDGIIYSYQGYTTRNELATYSGRSDEALLAYAALYYMGSSASVSSYSSAGNSSNHTHTDASSSGNSGAGCVGGEGCMTVFGFAFFFVIAAIIVTLIDYYPYYTYVHTYIPIIVLAIILIKRIITTKQYKYTLNGSFKGAISGVAGGLIITFMLTFLDIFADKYMAMGRNVIISYETAYTCLLINSGIIGILMSAEEKK